MLVIDGSGSMAGNAIDQARESAELFIRDLPLDSGDASILKSASLFNVAWTNVSH